MPKALDLTGKRFGKLVAISKEPSRKGKTYWLCKCDCGNFKVIQTGHLTSGASKSCGCNMNDRFPKAKGKKVIDFRRRIKLALVESFQHKCCACGLVDDAVVYDFHHLNPKEKSFGIATASTTRSRQAYFEEAKKCIMLCSNCHRKIEKGLISTKDFQIIEPNETVYWETLQKLTFNGE